MNIYLLLNKKFLKEKIIKQGLYLIRSLNQKYSNSFSFFFIYSNPVLKFLGVQMKYIDNLKDLDVELQRVDEKFALSNDEGVRALSEFCYIVDDRFPQDPYSQEYFDAQMKLYLKISGREGYSVSNEHVEFDYEALKNNPYPYNTHSPDTVGNQLVAQGFLIKILNLAPHSRIVEFGPGWGNTTLHFTQMGYDVTAVDSEKAFLDLIEYRTAMLNKKVELVHQDMLSFSSPTPYDAAVFFECFHHCANHLKLLKNLEQLIKDDGLIAFAAEPIADAPYFPFPWGVRLEGMSVWSIRKFGWLELGFDTSYFLRTLLFFGWTPKRYRSDASPLADVIIAKKSHGYYEPSEITLPPDECMTWAPKEMNSQLKLRFTQKKSVMSCAKNIQVKSVEFCFSNYAPFNLDVQIIVGSSTSNLQIPKSCMKGIYKIPVSHWNGQITITTKTWRPSKILRNGDNRELGVAVNSIRLIENIDA